MTVSPLFTPVDTSGYSLAAGGESTAAISAGATGAQTVKAGPGRLARIVLAAANGAAAISVYDNASAASGTVIGLIPATAAAGVYDFQMPAKLGITVGGAATNPAMAVGYA